MPGDASPGANDVPRASAFSDALRATVGIGRLMQFSKGPAHGLAVDRPRLAIGTPFDSPPATAGHGTMVALPLLSKAMVDALHARALGPGGTDEGGPGNRGPASQGFHGADSPDFDGNRLACVRIALA